MVIKSDQLGGLSRGIRVREKRLVIVCGLVTDNYLLGQGKKKGVWHGGLTLGT